ncbi:MAG: cbb3-type cytochrome oxidase assembly protein CcoS [Ignavibacteriae bacterium]|jgi:cbb3-type cytochrome oxidase maturation protein|nr:cbb3-type cytochrome oxidase assembly protein CcoS [Ignavibacteriota bacterium]NOG97225.1 cbb3-type cytochrome oxidase assembly protein CcoS [Ignavibacteriota bacterium]
MMVIVVLISASLLVAIGFLAAFLWAVKSGQYDDKYTPAVRILFDDKKKNNETEKDINSEEKK